MFVDIVGSTAMIEREPIDSVFEFLRAFNGHLARTVFDHAGTLDKFTGDGIMATFGTPVPGEQDAANAIACARAIAAGLEDWNRARRAAGMTPVKVGIGVHWGDALMGTVGDEQRLEFSVIGDAVNIAHRLETLSRELRCNIAASEAVVLKAREQGADVSDFVPRGPQTIRGRADPVEVWSFTRPPATPQE
jgi:adenylate cyclase